MLDYFYHFFSLLFSIVSHLIFIAVWCFLLAGIFLAIRYSIRSRHPEHPFVANLCGYLVVSSLIFELLRRIEEEKSIRELRSMQGVSLLWCSSWNPFVSHDSCLRDSAQQDVQPLWRLNPVSVIGSLLVEVFSLGASLVGRPLGSLYNSFLRDLSWTATAIAAVPLVFFPLLAALLYFRYNFSLFYGAVKISPSSSPSDTPKQHRSQNVLMPKPKDPKPLQWRKPVQPQGQTSILDRSSYFVHELLTRHAPD